MISDFKQPAKYWLADVLNNLGNFLKDGEDPCFTITIDGIEIEIRLNNIPGEFNRQQMKVPNATVRRPLCDELKRNDKL